MIAVDRALDALARFRIDALDVERLSCETFELGVEIVVVGVLGHEHEATPPAMPSTIASSVSDVPIASQVSLDENIDIDALATQTGMCVVFQSAWSDHEHGNALWASEPGRRDVGVELEAADERDARLRVREAVEPHGGKIISTPPVSLAQATA